MSISLNQKKLFSALDPIVKNNFNIEQIYLFEDIDSTQHYLRNELVDFPSLVVAETQRAGKGRFARNWYSKGENILMSCSWRYHQFPRQLTGLGLALIVELADLLHEEFAIISTIKWPNDLLISGKKVAGLLIDVESGSDCQIYIGLGLNIRQDAGLKIDQPWIDLASLTDKEIDRNNLMAKLFSRWFITLMDYPYTGFQPFRRRWIDLSEHNGKLIVLSKNNKVTAQGIMRGIDDQGFLLVESNGKLTTVTDSECSMRLLDQ